MRHGAQRALLALAGLALATAAGPGAPLCGTAWAATCCKVCRKGKACGDSCIAADRPCNTGKGCACNAPR